MDREGKEEIIRILLCLHSSNLNAFSNKCKDLYQCCSLNNACWGMTWRQKFNMDLNISVFVFLTITIYNLIFTLCFPINKPFFCILPILSPLRKLSLIQIFSLVYYIQIYNYENIYWILQWLIFCKLFGLDWHLMYDPSMFRNVLCLAKC